MKPPFWGTREFHWLIGILVLVGTLFGIIVFELAPLQTALLEKQLERFPPQQADFLPRPSQSKLPLDPALDEALATAKDPTPVEETDRAYRALIDYLGKAPSAVVTEEASTVAYEVFARRSPELRGRPFRLTALLIHWTQVAVDPPAGTTEFIYRAYLLDPSGSETYVVDLLEEPKGLPQKEMVRTEALYLRRGSYETRDQIVEVPQLLGQSLRALERTVDASTTSFPFLSLGVALSVLAVGLLFLTFYVQRRALQRTKRALPSWPVAATSGKVSEQPWEGFVERSWKAAAAPQPRPGWVPRRSPRSAETPGGNTARRRPVFLRVGLWLVLASLTCVGLTAWTVYRIWRDSQPPAAVVIDFDAASALAVRDAETARDRIRRVQESLVLAAPGSGSGSDSNTSGVAIDASSRPELEVGLRGLERAAERLQELLYLARRSGRNAEDPTFRQRGRDFARLELWVLDAADFVKHARGQGTGQETTAGFFLPYLRLAAARARIDAEMLALTPIPTATANASTLKAQIDSLLGAAGELETYLKVGLGRDSLEPADIPEIASFRADRNALEQHRQTLTKLLSNP